MKYVDHLSLKDLLTQYPELKGSPIVDPDIIDDAETLATIPDSSLDFVIANHLIEHMRNPIKALLSWQRVLKPGGRIFLAAPDKWSTFDRDREITEISHLVADYENPSEERDYEAYLDFAKCVTCLFFKAQPVEEYERVAKELLDTNYSIHFHVWDHPAFAKFLEYMSEHISGWNMEVIASRATVREFIFVLEKQNPA